MGTTALQEPDDRGEPNAPIWRTVERLVDGAARIDDLVDHGIAIFAARRLRSLGREVPAELAAVERRAAVATLAAPVLLERVRGATDAELVLHKGPEVASYYPDRALRGFGDVDLIVREPQLVHRALLEAGAVEVGDPSLYLDIHHLRPVSWLDLPIVVEIHARPKWVDALTPLPGAAVFAAVQPAAAGVDGFLAPSPAEHAVLLAVHSWAHEPLRRLRDMIDVAVVLAAADRAEAAGVARAWGVERLWSTTVAAVDAVLGGADPPPALRLWARNLERVRGRTVLENHLERWFSDFSIMEAHRAALGLPRTLIAEVTPEEGESWGEKLGRSARAVRNGLRRRRDHDDEIFRRRDQRDSTSS